MANNNNANQLPLTTNYHVFPTRVTSLNFLNQVVNNGLAPVHPDVLQLNLYASVPDQVIGVSLHGSVTQKTEKTMVKELRTENWTSSMPRSRFSSRLLYCNFCKLEQKIIQYNPKFDICCLFRLLMLCASVDH
ncbi:hypothetical protein CTI12_AA121650 [Artemisia annua]|uniref:Uncharacterized protein n=1 Tax=Artemisia annua TaxID=35608 RepID=A0A2U1PQ71_ARTAN|nr:hypothetical protein CTI12_AA121650 [Artemisia annua]